MINPVRLSKNLARTSSNYIPPAPNLTPPMPINRNPQTGRKMDIDNVKYDTATAAPDPKPGKHAMTPILGTTSRKASDIEGYTFYQVGV